MEPPRSDTSAFHRAGWQSHSIVGQDDLMTSRQATPVIVSQQDPDPAEREAILQELKQYNESKAGPSGVMPLAVLLRDPKDGRTVGGLWGRTAYGWLYVELLFVPESLRKHRLGTKLLREAEAIALARGCHGAWLDTYGFQAKGFYEKQGYEPFGVLSDYPRGTDRLFMRKRLAPLTPSRTA
jgi:GNAT superfamily N-acetyltransferase